MTKFKTTLLAMAVSAAAFSVQAAQVSLYGSVDFDRMEIEYIDPDAKKKRSKDPRNAF